MSSYLSPDDLAHDHIVAPSVPDGLGARLAQHLGFRAVYISGFSLSATLGLPDVGLTTRTQVARRAATIAAAVEIPTFCDVDTGFGDDNESIMRTVRDFENAGVAGIKLEDQVTPANRVGRPVIPVDAMTEKIAAAAAARTCDDFLLIARTDAAPTLGLEEAISRCRAFEAAGADVTHALDVGDVSNMRRLVKSLTKPAFGVISSPHPPVLPVSSLVEIGYRFIVVSVPIQFAGVHRVWTSLNDATSGGAVSSSASQRDDAGYAEMRDLART